MRNTGTKFSGASADPSFQRTSEEANTHNNELANAVERCGIGLEIPTPQPKAATVNDVQLHQAIMMGGNLTMVDTGTTNAYVVNYPTQQESVVNPVSPQQPLVPPFYPEGYKVQFVPQNTSTAFSTLNIGGLGVRPIYLDEVGSAPIRQGDIMEGVMHEFIYLNSLNGGNGGFYLSQVASTTYREIPQTSYGSSTFQGFRAKDPFGVTLEWDESSMRYIYPANSIISQTIVGPLGSTISNLTTNRTAGQAFDLEYVTRSDNSQVIVSLNYNVSWRSGTTGGTGATTQELELVGNVNPSVSRQLTSQVLQSSTALSFSNASYLEAVLNNTSLGQTVEINLYTFVPTLGCITANNIAQRSIRITEIAKE